MIDPARQPLHWPPGSVRLRIAYVADAPADRRVVAELPSPLNRRAIALPDGAGTTAELELLSIPAPEIEDPELIERVREWTAAGMPTVQMMTFQGAQLFWGEGRAAVMAAPHRLAALEAVVVELAYYEAELVGVERAVAGFWPELEADGGPAFEMDERAHRHRARLARRFRELLGVRARLTRIIPFVHTPHVYPPTLASQVSERLRERTRMRHRAEVLQDQLEVFERIYDACGARAGEFTANRKNHLLEMVIIVLLAAQTLLVLFEILTRART